MGWDGDDNWMGTKVENRGWGGAEDDGALRRRDRRVSCLREVCFLV